MTALLVLYAVVAAIVWGSLLSEMSWERPEDAAAVWWTLLIVLTTAVIAAAIPFAAAGVAVGRKTADAWRWLKGLI